ncbi:MAG: site-specific integrase, partial [Eubacteriales bacterium]|nr:site-specific integrase [Eubacteriales bacterium]
RDIPTVEQFIMSYLRSVRYNITGRTLDTKMNFCRHIIKGLGHYKVDELTKSIIRDFIYAFASTPYIKNKKGEKEYYGQDIINKVYNLIKSIVRELVEEQYLDQDIMINVKKPKSKKILEKAKNQALSKEEIREIFSLVNEDPMLKVTLHMLLFLGLRPGELFGLKWSDIDRQKRTVRVTRTLSEEPIFDESGKKIKTIPIIKKIKNDNGGINFAIRTLSFSPILEAMLNEWQAYIRFKPGFLAAKRKKETADYIFSGENGELARPQYYLRRYRNYLQKRGYEYNEFNYYRFRHTFATAALRKGLDLKSVQMLLGDNDAEMVLKIYANLSKVEILEAHEKFSAAYAADILDMSDEKVG